jgi:hypothetical protein
MARRLDGSDKGVLITRESARRIQRVVQMIEGGSRDIAPPPLRTAYDDGDQLRVGKIVGDWAIGACYTIALYEEPPVIGCNPAVSAPSEFIEDVVNVSKDVADGSWVVIGKAADGRWYLLEAGKEPWASCRATIGGEDITKWPGWNASTVQLLGHDENGCLKWFDSTECDEGSGS